MPPYIIQLEHGNARRVGVTLNVAFGADVGSDVIIMLLPLYLLMKSRISTKQKVGLACMFSLGFIIIIFAFIRFHSIKRCINPSETNYVVILNGPVSCALWSQVEATIALLVTNIPAFRSLIAQPGGTRLRPAKQYCGRPSNPQNSNITRLSGGLDIASQTRIPKSRLCRSSFEIHSLHSESSLHRNQVELWGEHTPERSSQGIMRTMEVDVDSYSRGEETLVSHPFVPPT